MVRDITKSMLSFSWAMSLFGVKQLTNVLSPQSPSQATHKTASAFNAVAQVTEDQLGDMLRGAFKAGDQLQKGIVDMTLGFISLEALNPSQMMKMASDMMQQSSAAFGQSRQGGDSRAQESWSSWGPAASSSGASASQQASAAPSSGSSFSGNVSDSQQASEGWGPV